jgi:nitroimidazol reductase NimA-like FMN-containing flavoprotein (pyridoxamine 5'-phosphate oxidase superfamily)
MLTPEEWTPSRLRDLTEQECRELLHERRIGRVAWCAADGPMVLPVNYLSDGDQVLFRTSAHSELARRFSPGPVAFEIDAFDEATRSGWSVVVRGPAELLDRGALPPPGGRPDPWAGGTRNIYVRIAVDRVSGRRLLPP